AQLLKNECQSVNLVSGSFFFCVYLQLYQCMSDLECSEGNYCHIPTKGPTHSRCKACRRRNRRCQRDSMCCPGNRCNNICVADVDSFLSQSILDLDGDRSSTPKKGWKRRGRVNVKGSSGKGQVGDPCLRSSDCSDSLCCARHFWTRICKPVLREGQVCTRQRRKGHQGLELFQRCSCGEGLACRALRDPSSQTPYLHLCCCSFRLTCTNLLNGIKYILVF
uniref:Dickkopf-related protein 2-like n=1 Tax=Cyprinodon variegatus TaxID=28743 RepID=A0A3Q2C6Q2_CYPVA